MPSKTPPLARYADKAPTELQTRFSKWITKQTGVEVDERSVALAVSLRMTFQTSDENQKVLADRKAASEAARKAKADRKPASKAAPATPAVPAKRRRAAAKPAAEPDAVEVPAEVVEAEPRPEPQFEDPKADAAVEAAQAKPATPRRRRNAKDANKDLVD